MTATTLRPADRADRPVVVAPSKPRRTGRVLLYVFLTVMGVIWLFPVFFAVVSSFRDYAYTSKNGYVSFGGFTLQNYVDAWQQANFGHSLVNSLVITVPRKRVDSDEFSRILTALQMLATDMHSEVDEYLLPRLVAAGTADVESGRLTLGDEAVDGVSVTKREPYLAIKRSPK